MVAMARGSEDCLGVAGLRLLFFAGEGVTLGDRIGGRAEEPVIGEVEGEREGRRGFHDEPLLGFPLMRSLICAGERGIVRGARSQKSLEPVERIAVEVEVRLRCGGRSPSKREQGGNNANNHSMLPICGK